MQPQWKPYIVEVPITVNTAAYTAEDVVGGSTLGYCTFASPVPQAKGGGYIAWLKIVDDADQKEPFRVYIYDAAPSTIADADPFAPVEADWIKQLGRIDVATTDYDAAGADACAMVAGKDASTEDYIWFDALDSGKLYFRFVANASTPDYVAGDDVTVYVCLLLA